MQSGFWHSLVAGLQSDVTIWMQSEMAYIVAECTVNDSLSCADGMQCFTHDAPAGTDVKALLQKCLHSILGSALPYKETGDAEERALANTVTAGGLLLKYLTGKVQIGLLRVTLNPFICSCMRCFRDRILLRS